MSASADHPLLEAWRHSGRLGADALAELERLLASHADDPLQLADRVNDLGFLTKYQHRKLQTGRWQELIFGQYLILERIGEGGMGKVYRAYDRLGREVALKTIRPNLLANKTVISRYKREAKAAASLVHDNIVKLYDADDVDGRYYLAMEYIDGCDLSRLTKDLAKEKRTIHPSEAAEYGRQAALGLQHAHDMNLVHRDIKPSNLLVYGERALPGTGGKAILKILDMGLVRSLIDADDDASSTDLTRDGTVVGTPDYMSPEQAKNSSTVDPRSDVYSLGCTLYFLLKGAPPFAEGTAIDKLIRHQLDPIPDIRQYRPDVPPGLATVIRKMMAKKPDDRFQSGKETARELGLYTEEAASFDFGSPAPKYQNVDLAPANTPVPDDGGQVRPSTQSPNPKSPAAPRPKVRTVRPIASPAVSSSTTTTTTRMPSDQVIRKPQATKPLAAPAADQTPSGETAGRGRSGETPVAQPKPKRPAGPAKKPVKKPDGPPWTIIIAAIGGAISIGGIVVMAVLLNLDRTPPPATTEPTPPPTMPVEERPPLRPMAELLPDRTAAVLVADPRRYWKKLQFETKLGQPAKEDANELKIWWNLDFFRMERIVFAMESAPKRSVLIAEGEPMYKAEAFRKELEQVRRFKHEIDADGTLLMKPAFGGPMNQQRVRAAFVPRLPAYFIGHAIYDLTEGYKDPKVRTGPADVDPKLLAVLSEADAVTNPASVEPLLIYFAASGKWLLRDKPGGVEAPLKNRGVDLLTIKLALDGNRVDLGITAYGKDDRELSRFLEVDLPMAIQDFGKSSKLAKELAAAVRESIDRSFTGVGHGLKTRTIAVQWTWEQTQQFFDQMLIDQR